MTLRSLFAVLMALGPAMGETLYYLPMEGELEKPGDLKAANGLYRDVWQGQYKGDVRFAPDSVACFEKPCAVELAKAAGAGEVVFSSIRRLGGKLIFSSTIVNVKSGEPFNQRATAIGIEDMEQVTLRVAQALYARKSLEQVATTDNITVKEEDSEPTRRRSLYSSGFALGYLYPAGGSYSFLRSDGTEYQPHGAMIRLGWLNSWEFRDNMILSFDGVWSMPNDLGGDITLQYLFGRNDYTPFVGGGLGLHYIFPDSDNDASDHRHSGPTPIAQAGMILFRTYDIHVIAKAQYQATLNSDIDHGVAVDVGVIYQPKEKRERGGGGVGAVIGYTLLGLLALSFIGAVSSN